MRVQEHFPAATLDSQNPGDGSCESAYGAYPCGFNSFHANGKRPVFLVVQGFQKRQIKYSSLFRRGYK